MSSQVQPGSLREALPVAAPPVGLDLLRLPLVGSFLRSRTARTSLRWVLLLLGVAMVLHGFLGPQLAPRNLATVLSWVHYRGALVLVLLLAGNFFCMACPFLLPRELARRFVRPALLWPRALRNKWLAIGLLVAILFAYELFDLWATPWWTAWLVIGYFAAAFAVDALFQHASFCKYVCPIGQFNFVASTLSPFEVKVREPEVCTRCETKDCIRGRRAPGDAKRIVQRGCELALFQPLKVGNLDCTFCLDCVDACPHANVGVIARLPGAELAEDGPRSGIGRLARRPDVAALGAVFVFGALLNAFGMVSPVYALESWLAARLRLGTEAPVLGILWFLALVVEPAVLLGFAAWWTRRATGAREGLLAVAMRHAYALVPLGFAVWVAHYSFHFFTGLWTFVPVAQSALADLGLPVRPDWSWGGISAARVWPLEVGFLALGLLGSLGVAHRLAARYPVAQRVHAFAPWAGLCVLLGGAALWLLAQPMEMRGTFLGGG